MASATALRYEDASKDSRELLGALLESAGYRVWTAADGREGLRSVFANRPDLVLVDVVMPNMDGWELLGRIRDMSDTPVMMLTALGAEEEKVRGLRSGADDYLVKPFGRAELLARVGALLRRTRPLSEVDETYTDPALHMRFRQPRGVSVRAPDTTDPTGIPDVGRPGEARRHRAQRRPADRPVLGRPAGGPGQALRVYRRIPSQEAPG